VKFVAKINHRILFLSSKKLKMKYLQLIRYKNLLLLAFMQLLFRYGFLKLQKIELALTHFQYGLLVLATVLIAAGGYVINDIFDQETDDENKPTKRIVGNSISEAMAYNIYSGLTIAGVIIGFFLSNQIYRSGFFTIFIFIAALLYFYATSLKQILLLGNIAVALLLSFSVLIIGFFDIFPATADDNRPIMSMIFGILKDYAIFAFILNFIREIVKDCEDIKGDLSEEMKTLPIVLGIPKTTKLVSVLLLVPIMILLWYINSYLMSNNLYYAVLYAVVLVLTPLIFCAIKIWTASQKKDFKQISTLLKWIIFFGILSVTVIHYNVKLNA
jgi:4-hydroxybenzoate polyprenyltransferase